MKNKIAEVRLTLYALISSIESDLRNIIRQEIIPSCSDSSFLIDELLIDNTKKRFQIENIGFNPDKNLDLLVDYLDFQDSYKVILKNKTIVSEQIIYRIKKIVPQLDRIAPIRNRIMHSRPLISGDFSSVYSFVIDLCQDRGLKWNNCISTMQKLEEDPSFVLTINIPSDQMIEDIVNHNLPMPDFDESGFIGREKDIDAVKKLILGNNRVISILGDGGIGKTALILKTAYDILDSGESCPFECIIWSTAKTTMLTPTGIQDIQNTMGSFSNLIENITTETTAAPKDLKTNIKEILEFMENFKVLLIIDNLETIIDDTVRLFIREASLRCKIAITSRIGLGELEFPKKLSGLSDKESSLLIREMAKLRNNEILTKLSNRQLANISKQLHYNPLALKWFIQSVDTGKNPEDVLGHKDDLLNFCLKNVYDKLSSNEILLINILIASRHKLNDAELSYLSDLESIDLRKALNVLFTTTLIQKEINPKQESFECYYVLSQFAKEYLLKNHPPKARFVKDLNKKHQHLKLGYEDTKRISAADEFNVRALEIRNSNERVVSKYLQEALKYSSPRIQNYDEAYQKIESARNIIPNYFEVYRVSALVKYCKGDLIGSEDDYKKGLEIEPNNQKLLYFYAGFLLMAYDDPEIAKPIAKKAMDIKKDAAEPSILYARCLGYLGSFEEAIRILNNIFTEREKYSSKNIKISATLLIDFYKRWAIDDRIIRKDYNAEVEKLEKAMSILDLVYDNNEADLKILKEYSEAFYNYLKILSKSNNEEKKNRAISTYIKYKTYLDSTSHGRAIHSILMEKYPEFAKQNKSDEEGDTKKRYVGKINKFFPHKYFGFILCDGLGDGLYEIYFNKNNLSQSTNWSELNTNITVEFSIGTNPQGECAIQISILDIRPN